MTRQMTPELAAHLRAIDESNRKARQLYEDEDSPCGERPNGAKRRAKPNGAEAERFQPPPNDAPPVGHPIAESEVLLTNARTLMPEPISWLWPNWLQRRAFNLIAGKSTAGKSTIALSLCATITSGGQWPDGHSTEPFRALYWSGEDGVCDTLLPRFLAAGGAAENMFFIEGVRDAGVKRPFDPAVDMKALAAAIEKIGDVALIVLDPIALTVKGDSHKNVETRVGLQPFADLCAQIGACGLGVHHLTKFTDGSDPLERVSGSLAFHALPRCVLLAAKDLNEGMRRVLLRVKVANGPDRGGFDYQLQQRALDRYPEISAQCVLWGKTIEGAAREILAELEEKPADGKQRKAVLFLAEALKDGPQLAAEVTAKAGAAGIPERTLRYALKDLGVTPERHGKGRGHFVLWELPNAAAH
jgi:putative DNA primase/helicase